MPSKRTLARAAKDKQEGKSPSTQAGEFVREEMDHIREGKHGARSTKQAIAIGLSKARRAGVDLKPPRKGRAKESTRKSAERDYAKGHSKAGKSFGRKNSTSSTRSKARLAALKREPHSAASNQALSRQAKSAAQRRKRSGTVSTGSRRKSTASRKAA